MSKWYFLGKRSRRVKMSTEVGVISSRVLRPVSGQTPAPYISVPEKDIPRLATEYIAAMETQHSEDWCRCEWIIHPDDIEKPKGKRRKRRGEEAEDCPVHTRTGLVIYFFEWIFSGRRVNGN